MWSLAKKKKKKIWKFTRTNIQDENEPLHKTVFYYSFDFCTFDPLCSILSFLYTKSVLQDDVFVSTNQEVLPASLCGFLNIKPIVIFLLDLGLLQEKLQGHQDNLHKRTFHTTTFYFCLWRSIRSIKLKGYIMVTWPPTSPSLSLLQLHWMSRKTGIILTMK